MTEPPVAVTMGEPAGIGGELALALWLTRREALPPFFLVDDPARLGRLAARIGAAVPIAAIDAPGDAAAAFGTALPVLPLGVPVDAEPGRLDSANGSAVIASIDRAVALARAGEAGAVVTLPIHKKALYDAGFAHPGHTEYLATLAGPGYRSVMMLACPALRVVPVTIHIPVSEVPAALDVATIVDQARIVADSLRRDFGVERPRLAVAGLNPHAGEGGAIGREEIEVIAPAIEALRGDGEAVSGPLPADTMFHEEARAGYDVALCMYHDQALVPIKTLDFWSGVNVTLGLPFIRTSPDHGTALGLAGSGRGDGRSLAASLAMAASMAAHRRAAPR